MRYLLLSSSREQLKLLQYGYLKQTSDRMNRKAEAVRQLYERELGANPIEPSTLHLQNGETDISLLYPLELHYSLQNNIIRFSISGQGSRFKWISLAIAAINQALNLNAQSLTRHPRSTLAEADFATGFR